MNVGESATTKKQDKTSMGSLSLEGCIVVAPVITTSICIPSSIYDKFMTRAVGTTGFWILLPSSLFRHITFDSSVIIGFSLHLICTYVEYKKTIKMHRMLNTGTLQLDS